jgi:hypothetical protein
MQDPNIFFHLLTIAIAVVFGFICYFIAKGKSRNQTLWAILGFLFCFIAFAILICLPKKPKVALNEPLKESSAPTNVMHNESAAALNDEDSFEPRKPRLSGSKTLNWYYINQKANNSILGPFSINELRKQIQSNKLDSSTYIWCEEFEGWMKISEFSNSSLLLDADFIE